MSAPDPTAGEPCYCGKRRDEANPGCVYHQARKAPAIPDADDASEPLTEAERSWGIPRENGATVYAEHDVERIVADREAAAATKARAEGERIGFREGYEMARSDMVSGAFIGGPTYEALRDSFTGQRIVKDERERIAQAIERLPLTVACPDPTDGLSHTYPRGPGQIRVDAARIARGDA